MSFGTRLSAFVRTVLTGLVYSVLVFSFRVSAQEGFALNVWLRADLDNGRYVVDYANRLRFEPDARVDWDRHDSGKPMPPEPTRNYVLLSPEGVRNGDYIRQAVRSLPSDLDEAVTIPVAFQATSSGSFEILAIPIDIPDGWSFTLQDFSTQELLDLQTAETTVYDFLSPAVPNWENRFEITVIPPGVVVASEENPQQGFHLSSVSPNPVSGSAALALRVDETQPVTARVYDTLGQLVTTVHNGPLAASEDVRLEIDASGLAAGAYMVRVEGDAFAETRRFAVVR